MEVKCEQCQTKLNIPEDKIPQDQVVKISCPKCKNKITLDTRSTPEEEPSSELDAIQDRVEEGASDYNYSDYSSDEALEFYEEGTKLALVMPGSPDQAEKIRVAVEELGYKHVVTPNTRDAIGKLRFHHFDLVILCDVFDGHDMGQSPILNYLNHTSISVRRRIFLALIGDKFRSMDNMMTFAQSANVVFNTKDLEELSGILKRSISEHEKFYKVFKDTLIEMGKA
jgi:predicted Zn finger-like uncharacterized protein